jgi:ribonuclease HII
LHAQGFALVAGVDEAGRGALAGPLVAAAVILPEDFMVDGLADSKVLTPEQRDVWFDRIRAGAISIGVCRAFPSRIDHRGLHVSNLFLLRRAVTMLDVRPEFVLSDGFPLRGVRLPQLSIKKGDAVTASVAAASVIAKVTRDRIMERYHRRYPQYGSSPIHRMSFKGMDLYANDREKYVALYARNGSVEEDE